MENMQQEYRKFIELKRKINPREESLKISIIYMAIGIIWIIISDHILDSLDINIHILKQIQIYKGWLYVFITGAFYYTIIKRSLQLYDQAVDKVLLGYEQLSSAHEELIAMNEELQQNITERKEIEARLQRLAYYDELTDLPNRAFLEKEVTDAIKDNKKFAVIILDIDDFKHINDTMGHSMGDIFIRNFATMLTYVIVEPDLLVRLSGNQFAFLLHDMETTDDVAKRLDQIVLKVKTPWNIDIKKFYMTASMGAVLYPEHGADFASLTQKAEIAMFNQKAHGKDGYTIFESAMHEERIRFIQMSNELRDAIQNNEFLLYYQPQYDIKNGAMLGVEALIRWNHPERGFVSPMEFIPLSEKTGYIIEISEWVLKTAINQKREWDRKGFPSIKMAINLSGYVITDTKAFENICKILMDLEVKPGEIEVEVTETAVMMELEKAKDNLQRLRDFGISIAMDDFGTGYSSLNYLHLLPFDILKIDREFIKNVKSKEEDIFIYRTVVGLAHDMKLDVVAEGIETKEQEDFLIQNNCDIGQGYFYCKPVPAVDIENILHTQEEQKK
jgi:diguanylate cyclase (GGDEF)-like protein